MSSEIILRKASRFDVSQIAGLFRRTRETSMPYLPVLHTQQEDATFFQDVVCVQDTVWVAERSHILGFCASRPQWLDHLYVDSDHQHIGIGSALLNIVTARNPVLNLWVFQKNLAAIRFYEKRGFILIRKTDGQANEEHEPDALYRRVAA